MGGICDAAVVSVSLCRSNRPVLLKGRRGTPSYFLCPKRLSRSPPISRAEGTLNHHAVIQ